MRTPDRRQLCKGCLIPISYEVWADGVFARMAPKGQRRKRDDDEGPREAPPKPTVMAPCPIQHRETITRVTYAPLWISGYGWDPDDHTQIIRLSTIHLGRSIHQWIQRERVFDARSLVHFARLGYPVTSENAPAVIAYLSAIEAINASNERLLRHPVVHRSGLVKVDGKVGWLIGKHWIGPKGTKVGLSADAAAAHLARALRTAGEEDAWANLTREILWGDEPRFGIARFLVFAGFAAPLLRVLGQRSFLVHHWGHSGSGKSALSRLTAAAFANPEDFVLTLNRTKGAFTETFRYLTDLPAIFNELQASGLSDKELNQEVYKMIEGQGRGRATRLGGLQEAVSWVSVIRFNGEQPLLGKSTIDLGGLAPRVVQTRAEALTQDEARRLNEALNKGHFGHAGQKFLRGLVRMVNEHRNLLDREFDRLENAVRQVANEHSTRRAPQLAIIALAEMLARMILFGESQETARQLSLEDLVTFAESIDVGAEKPAEQTARHILGDYYAANPGAFLPRMEAKGSTARAVVGFTDRALVDSVEVEGIYWIESAIFKILRAAGLNPDRAIDDLKTDGTLVGERRIRLGSSKADATRFRVLLLRVDRLTRRS